MLSYPGDIDLGGAATSMHVPSNPHGVLFLAGVRADLLGRLPRVPGAGHSFLAHFRANLPVLGRLPRAR